MNASPRVQIKARHALVRFLSAIGQFTVRKNVCANAIGDDSELSQQCVLIQVSFQVSPFGLNGFVFTSSKSKMRQELQRK